MTKEEAKLFFNHSKEDDLEDLWEERFFKQKKYFLTRTPIPKVWQSKLQKLKKEYEAFLLLAEKKEKKSPKKIKLQKGEFPEDFIAAFHCLHQWRNEFKTKVSHSETPLELGQNVEEWLCIETQYANYWSVPKSEEEEVKVAQSKEPDPMEWLTELKGAQQNIHSSSIHIFKENYNNLSENAKKEVKRLTLLAKYNYG